MLYIIFNYYLLGVETPTKQVKIVLEEENVGLRRSARKSIKNKRYTNDSFEDLDLQFDKY